MSGSSCGIRLKLFFNLFLFAYVVSPRGACSERLPFSLSNDAVDLSISWAIFESDNYSFEFQVWDKFSVDTSKDSPSEQALLNHLELRPYLVYDPGESISATLSFEGNFFNVIEQQSDDDSSVQLFEAYLNHHSSSHNIRLGNQIVTWGRTDLISPLDNVNPEDLRDGFVRLRNERKIPVPMANVELIAEEQQLQLIVLPSFRRHKIDLANTRWSLLGEQEDDFEIESTLPDGSSKVESGARYSVTFESFDAALSFLSSRSDFPISSSCPLPRSKLAPSLTRMIMRSPSSRVTSTSWHFFRPSPIRVPPP